MAHNRVTLVREAGGIGDILCCGAAAKALKDEHPNWCIELAVPTDFLGVAIRLEGVSRVHALGLVSELSPVRRRRDAPMDPTLYPYLRNIPDLDNTRLVSLFCPGFGYESSCSGPLQYNRAQLFAIAAGAKDVTWARPVWSGVTPAERSDDADGEPPHWGVPVIALQPRATCPCRSLPHDLLVELLDRLSVFADVYYVDCIQPPVPLPDRVTHVSGWSIPEVAKLIRHCDIVVTVDSMLLHLAAAQDILTLGIFGPTDGENTVRTYPFATALETQALQAKEPCNYNREKGWDRSCRDTGCRRMNAHNVEEILFSIRVLLRKAKVMSGGSTT